MLPDREATVGYAIDLLRAHQLRRENAILHGEIQTCRKQLTSMQNELRELSVIVQECRTDSAKAHSLRDLQAARFKEQTLEIDRLRYDCEKVKAEVSNIQAANEQALEHAKAEIQLLQRQVQQERAVCQKTTDTHQHHLDETNVRVERLEVAIENKAEKRVIEPLVGRLNHLAVSAIHPGPRLDSVSLVRDSLEGRLTLRIKRICEESIKVV
jgi:chromosome segregation ATPase